ncbi:uncharacterized protein AMSG_01558 [Thecamonas trahens ATCC 50062]|uniref:Deoxynucleoside kinase domain-containing protein n=1 Tax=Thecamonas trahens ATCC 50062 TaxID=461836 RepID=A0A0L0DTC9_THETB|nr:hypothetical protein AMSG_01558 [Thecamonas trahens ATCC 50062]KNC54708.1 hypothetical protein AMSG_01558 [Thecamonas trahens ATCC 50062]|eukprot:XP_013761608.1 hypothetical protein AMSG_01558 [Thecamonas trahens ATCC 50062]
MLRSGFVAQQVCRAGGRASSMAARTVVSGNSVGATGDGRDGKDGGEAQAGSQASEQTADRVVLALEGSIGSGKSTLLRVVSEAMGGPEAVQTLAEPVERWKDVRGHNLLGEFYKDPSRWAYTFQSYAFVTRLMLAAEASGDAPVTVMERSPFSDKHVFATNAHESGLITGPEWAVYNELWDFYTASARGAPHAFVYLRTSAQTCFDRMRKRARAEEDAVPMTYLDAIHTRHEAWFHTNTVLDAELGVYATDDGIPFIVVEGEGDFEADSTRATEIVSAFDALVAWLRHRRTNANSE